MEEGQKKPAMSKKLMIIIAVIVIVIAGGIITYAMLTNSDKAQYFKAEKKTVEFMADHLKDRYEPEVDWSKQVQEKPTETGLTLSGEYHDPNSFGATGTFDPENIVNGTTLKLTSQTDLKKKQMATDIKANFGDIEIKDANVYLDRDQFVVGLPFLDESLKLKGKDTGKLMNQFDPSFPKDENLDFNTLFDMSKGLAEKDRDYLKKEYADKIYDDLSDDAFDSKKETVKVDGKKVKTKKLSMHLSEKETKDIMVSLLEKAQKDKKLKKMVKGQLEMQSFGLNPSVLDTNTNENIDDLFGDQLDKAIDTIKDAHIPDGITSDVWTKKDLIVKRDFHIKAGDDKENLASFKIKGTNVLNDDQQKFAYDFTGGNDQDKETIKLDGDLNWKNDKANDSIKLKTDDGELAYTGKETLKDDKRDFDRQFKLTTGMQDFAFNWSGNAKYDNDQMKSKNNFSVDAGNMDEDTFKLTVDKTGKTIKKVKKPDMSNAKDIGSMSIDQLMDYFQTDVAPKYQKWVMSLLGGDLGGNGDDDDLGDF